eukprot:2409133-Rhodomonas_salina.3
MGGAGTAQAGSEWFEGGDEATTSQTLCWSRAGHWHHDASSRCSQAVRSCRASGRGAVLMCGHCRVTGKMCAVGHGCGVQ